MHKRPSKPRDQRARAAAHEYARTCDLFDQLYAFVAAGGRAQAAVDVAIRQATAPRRSRARAR